MCALGFALEQYGINRFEAGFFKSNRGDIWPNNTKDFFMVYGYPCSLQDICPEGTAVAGKIVSVTAQYAGQSSSRFVHRLELLRKSRFDPDGLSGGLVLHVGSDNDGYFIGLAGFIVRGGKQSEIVHFVEAKAAHLLADQTRSA